MTDKPEWVREAEEEFSKIRDVAMAQMAAEGRGGEPEIEDLRRASLAIQRGEA